MEIDIYIKETEGSREIRIPWLPDRVYFDKNGARKSSYEILNVGEVNVPSGSNLETISWESHFPGKGHKDLPFLRGTWQDPKKLQNLLNEWSDKGTPLRVIMTGTPINHDVYIDDFSVEYAEGYGDYTYSITLQRRRDIKITSSTVVQRANTKKSTGTTYTVKSGDTLWAIARRFLGSGTKYGSIYSLNRTIIEQTAKRHGRSSSNGGHWIYPGTVLQIPGSGTSSSSSSSSSSSGKNNPPYAVLNKQYGVVKPGFASYAAANNYYTTMKGASKGWKIVDKNNKVVKG